MIAGYGFDVHVILLRSGKEAVIAEDAYGVYLVLSRIGEDAV